MPLKSLHHQEIKGRNLLVLKGNSSKPKESYPRLSQWPDLSLNSVNGAISFVSRQSNSLRHPQPAWMAITNNDLVTVLIDFDR